MLVVALLLPMATTVFAAPLAEVRVQGNHRIDAAAILAAVSSKSGQTLDQAKVDADIKAIFALGHFRDVVADLSDGDKGPVLTFVVSEKPIIRDIRIEGNKELSANKIREVLEVRGNTPYTPANLQVSVRKVKKLYADEGYYLAEVTTATEEKSPTEIRITFKIKEGKKIRISKIRFTGNHIYSDSKLKGGWFYRVSGGVMETREKWMFSWITGAGTYKDEVLKNDANLIADLYFNNGYVNIKVSEPKVELLPNKKGLLVTIDISEGEQYRVGSIGFSGDMIEPEETLRKGLKLESGEIFNRSLLRNDVLGLTDFYADRGYAFANVSPVTRLDQQQRLVNVTYDMEKGEKVYIERINISGNSKSRDKVVRRELRLAEGDLYSSSALKKSKQRLNNLGFFEEASLTTVKGSADNKLNLDVAVKEKPTGTFTIGAGYSSVDSWVAQGSIQQANFMGLGLKLAASASVGGKSQTYNLGITDPYFLDSNWTVGGDVYRTERDYLDFSRRVTGGDIKAGYPLTEDISTFWIYRYEVKEIFDETAAYNALPDYLRTDKDSTTSSVTASISRNTTDYRLDPKSGSSSSVSVEWAGLGGTNRYVRYIGDNATFFNPLWEFVFSLHGTLGYVQDIGKEVPIDEKFFLGGINTIRGYEPRTISPRKVVPVPTTQYVLDLNGLPTTDSNGNYVTTVVDVPASVYIGGNKEAVFNAELTFPLLKDVGLKGLLFFDAGNSYGDGDPLFSKFLMSYGGGIRWFSPIGPLRFEYGIPLNPRPEIDKAGGRFEFSIGGFF
jgi:outer membrane protein insertion porin family